MGSEPHVIVLVFVILVDHGKDLPPCSILAYLSATSTGIAPMYLKLLVQVVPHQGGVGQQPFDGLVVRASL